jgi:hypothetical protein
MTTLPDKGDDKLWGHMCSFRVGQSDKIRFEEGPGPGPGRLYPPHIMSYQDPKRPKT